MVSQTGSNAAASPGTPVHGFLPETAALSVILVWGSTFTITKSLYAHMHPLAFGGGRFVVIVAIAFLVLWLQSRRANRPDWLRIQRRDLALFVTTGLLGYTGYQIGFLLGLEHTSPFAGALMISLQPLVTLLIVTIIGERPSPLVWLGALIALGGVVLFLLSGDAESRWLGNLIAFGGGVSFALYQVFNRRLLREYHSATYSAWSTLFGAIPLVLIATPSMLDQEWSGLTASNWVGFAYMCVFPVYLAYILWGWSIKHRGVAISGYTLIVPIVAGVMSWMFYGESFGARKIIGGLVTVAGLVLMQWANVKQKRQRPA